jgi:ElaB/YqjD/DUF883 family membrane-anchored ribosome-binding protein/vacuolar-type H+-ATPase subunit H
MGQTTEELNTEIAGTRQDLASDLDALQDRVSPQAIIDRRKAAARSRLQGVRSKVMGSMGSGSSDGPGAIDKVRDATGDVAGTAQEKVEGSPLAAGAIAFAAGMVIAAVIPATDAEAQASKRLVDTAREQGGPIVDSAKSAGQHIASEMQDSASEAAQHVAETAKESARTVKEEGSASAERVKS